ncbi:hypothetical protein GCM10011506_44240 [Marivirga lumbricoides]|uniref:Uncharacterized protein n=2 Tax=Marivirga lumbricoides TaxID=1046115 RepID=A0ABQ1N4W6_9BACT|nr:hypothetical protein GCM10011506_44240 [Marivirga lumbricoides]
MFSFRSFGQENLTEKAKEKVKEGFKISGFLSANAVGYHVSGIPNRREPFYWIFSGNLNISFLEWSIPITATVSQQESDFDAQLPFNQFGVSPRYKSVTLHLGYRSLNFSEFTLAGNMFLGVGVEVAPENSLVKVSAMYGRFARALNERGAEGFNSRLPAYERWGYGSKVTVGNEKREADLIFFKAADNLESIDRTLADSVGLKPQENFVLGINTRQQITEKTQINVEYALSAYTTDTRNPEIVLDKFTYANNLGGIYVPRESSQFNGAISGSLTYGGEMIQLQVKYRRIGPEYKTMGSTFLNNDLEDITGGVSWRMLKGKINVSTNAGVQRNNLDDEQLSSMVRIVAGANIAYTVSNHLNLNASVANFNASSQLTQFSANTLSPIMRDSLYYLQVTNNASLGANYSVGEGDFRNVLFSNASYQDASSNQGNNTTFYNVNAGYQLNYVPADFTVSTSFNYNDNSSEQVRNKSFGPSLVVAKHFFKRSLKCSLTSTALYNQLNAEKAADIYSTKFMTAYSYAKKHTLSFDATYVSREAYTENNKSFNELRAGILYSYTF